MKALQKRNAENFLNHLGNRFLALDREPDYVMPLGTRIFLTDEAKVFAVPKLNFATNTLPDWLSVLDLVLATYGWAIVQRDTVALVVLQFENEVLIDRVTDSPDLIAWAKEKKNFVHASIFSQTTR